MVGSGIAGRDPRTIAVLIVEDGPMFETSVPLAVFGVDRSAAGVPLFRVLPFAVSGAGSATSSTAGMLMTAPYGLEALDTAGTVIVPTWSHPDVEPPAEILQALAEAYHDGARIVGLCLGAFVLAAAGLLDGRRATTHWMCSATLAQRYPKIQVEADVLYVDDGRVLTSAGSSSGIDACLHLLRRDHGASVAATVARRMVVPPHRSGGQAQYIERPVPDQADDHPVLAAAGWAVGRLEQAIEVGDMAARAAMSRRSFDRAFRELTGSSPLRWLLHQRVLRAQRLLESTDLSVDAVANAVGFASAVTLRSHFRRLVGVSPQSYRTTFRDGAGPTNDPVPGGE